MSSNILFEIRIFAYSFSMGAGLMMAYDFFRILRIFIPHHSLWIGLEDFVYWLYAAVMTFLLLYQQNDGRLRACLIGAVFLGMVCYNYLISRNFLNLLKKIYKYFRIKVNRLFGWNSRRTAGDEGNEKIRSIKKKEKR
ncbi:MAG TPA: spore cortex biosynthesis protein YabQ [Candidatus Hungatella pullicola]|nr:spore cortex biosynthesis protein YabQ [Candidatus Hungatella pullicola]